MNKLAILILAAGQSKRFGSAKQLAEIDGKPMLRRVFERCLAAGHADVYIVLGARSSEIKARLELEEATLLYAKSWIKGIGSTISDAVKQIEKRYEGVLLIAGDQPFVSAEQLSLMIEYWLESRELVCCASYGGSLGIPAIFPRQLFSDLVMLSGDRGAKQILLEATNSVRPFEMPDAERDIDLVKEIPSLGQPLSKD